MLELEFHIRCNSIYWATYNWDN